tara:strand:- start:73 stop:315 length:243 start_codon:yes stop_codon:yes gene_type:complete
MRLGIDLKVLSLLRINLKKIVIKSQIELEVDEKYDEEALLKANDWHQRVGKFLKLVDKTLATGVQFKDLRINIVEIKKES